MSVISLAVRTGARLALGVMLVLVAPSGAQVLLEDFDDNSIDDAWWSVDLYGSGPQLAEVNQQLEIALPGTSSGADFGARLVSEFVLRGDFDLQVDFRLLDWPFSNGVRLALAIVGEYGLERTSFGSQADYPSWPREVYLTDFADGVHGITATEDVTGTLRLVRTGATQTGYHASAGQWVAIHTGPAPSGDVAIQVHAWSHDYAFRDWNVLAAVDNLAVTSGEVIWPYIAVRTGTWGAIKAVFR